MSPDANPILRLQGFLPYRLSILSNRVSGTIARMYARDFGLTIWQWRVLAVVAEHGALRASDIAERTAMDKVAVSRAVARLIEKGHVKRLASARDGRSSQVTLTRKGRKVYDRIVPRARAYEEQLLEGFSEGQRAVLDDLMSTLLARARQLDDKLDGK
ncbi:MAG: MarR family transcriptional regulator [Pseudomonadota bacterium]